MPRARLLHILWCALLIVPPVLAQNKPGLWVHPDYTLKQWTRADGLPSNNIDWILQTSDGYLWMATSEGLVRYDGEQFTTFDIINTPSLRHAHIRCLHEGPPGYLWIVNNNSEVTLHHDGRFTPFEIAVVSRGNRAFFAEADTMWIGTTQGVMRFAEGRMEPYRQDQVDWPVVSIARDGQGRLWIATPNEGRYRNEGLYRIDPAGEVRHFTVEDGLPSSTVNVLLKGPGDVVWVGATGGIAKIRGDTVESWLGSPEASYFPRLATAEGGAWFSAWREGWRRHDPSGEVIFYPLSDPRTDVTPHFYMRLGPQGKGWHSEIADPSYRVQGGYDSIFREGERIFGITGQFQDYHFDHDGSLWVGTLTDGLFRLRPALLRMIGIEEGLPFRRVFSVMEDQHGAILISTFGGGVARLDAQGTVSTIPTPHEKVRLVYEDRAGTLWVGSIEPLCQIRENRCQEADVPLPETFTRDVQAMYEDQQGRFWIGTETTLAVRHTDRTGQRWISLTDEQGENPFQSPGVELETSDGTLFFGTQGQGLLRYPPIPATRPPRPTEGQPGPGPASPTIDLNDFESLTMAEGLLSNVVNDVYEDREGYLWLALDRGLCRLDRSNQPALAGADAACIDSRSGLHHHNLRQIAEDDQGRFWFNSTGSIFWIERAVLNAYFAGETTVVTSTSYTEADGVPTSGLGTTRARTFGSNKSRDGRIWFPTTDGVVVIDPDKVPWPEVPPVVLETVQIGEEVRRAPEALVLKADERDVSIQFTAPEFTRPDDVRYQYWLDGYDDTWREAGGQRLASYTNLPPGSYTFRVRSSLAGLWSEAVTLDIEREPYFWQTTWFLVLVALALLSTGPAIYTLRIRQLKAREAELEQVVEERTEELRRANELKSRFLANISHEFRTPLTLTFGPLDDLLQGRFHVDSAARPHLERARRNGHRLLRLINQLLDLSKLDAGALLLRTRRYDLAQHLRQMAALFESMAVTKDLHFTTEIPHEPVSHVYDADKIEKVVINLLSNAFKFTPSGGKVSLTFEQQADGAAQIEVADTGPGIAREELPRLFDRFYQVDSAVSRAHEGSGIGLSLVKELVELHQGTISVESTVGFGTQFTLRLPVLDEVVEEEEEALDAPEAVPAREVEMGASRLAGITVSEPLPEDAAPPTTPEEEAPVVLVVEDNADMRAYIRAHLEETVAVVEAENGRVGLERAREIVPDLILSDVMMPEMDGLEACAALKQDDRTSHIPVVLLTARAQVEHRIEGLESGADAYLPKPFNAQELQVRVRTLIAERRRLRARLAGMSAAAMRGDGAAQQIEEPARPVLPKREVAFLEKVEAQIAARLGDAQFGVDDLAESVSMSRRQLHRKLLALTDAPPAVLIRRQRLAQAAVLLREGAMSVKEVCYAVGFQSIPSFSRRFREVYGVPPSAYLEQAQDRNDEA